MFLPLVSVIHLRCHLLFVLLLPGAARRSIHIADSHYDGQQETDTFIKAVQGSAEAREALLPWGFGKSLLRLRAQHGQPVFMLDESLGEFRRLAELSHNKSWFSHHKSRLSQALRVEPRNAMVALHGAGGREEDKVLPKASPLWKEPARSIGDPAVSGGRLPLTVGYGTCLISPSDAERCVTAALDAGYRLFDTAQRYGNEDGMGKAIKSGISSGKLRREEVFVTTKVWVDNMGFSPTIDSVHQSADKLGNLDGGIDLVLMHWPGDFVMKDDPLDLGDNGGNAFLRKDTWEALEELRRDGVVKQIGVANFGERHLKELLEYAKVKPAVNQFEVHPFNQRTQLIHLCHSEGIAVQAYSPLGGKGNNGQVTDELLRNGLLKNIAVAHLKTVPEVILRWHLQRGVTPIPKSSTPARIRENFDVFDFELTQEEMDAIAKLDKGQFVILDADLLA